LDGKKDEFLLGVDHYWEAGHINASLTTAFDLLFERMHKGELLPALTDINGDLRLRKRKAAIKEGEEVSQRLVPQIEKLELAIEEVILLMKNNI
jgi:hypothetical protein